MKQPYDTAVGWQVLVRNLDVLTAPVADTGQDREALRTKLQAERLILLITTRVVDLGTQVRNRSIGKVIHIHCSNAESVFFRLHRRYGGAV